MGRSLNVHPEADAISIIARTPDISVSAADCVVTVPTFRRPQHLLKTLSSIAAQETTRKFAVIVIENDAAECAGAKAAAPLFERNELQGFVILAHKRGNCAAYNAGWQMALASFPAFRHLLVIDDDEIATPLWLETMCATAETLNADIVNGPVPPVFEDGAPDRLKNHPVFAPAYNSTGIVPMLYASGNMLVGRHVLETMEQPFLDLAFNFIGGGDSDFLRRAADKGFRLAWCDEAVVYETAPAGRLEPAWIRARSLRNGVISALVEKKARRCEPFGRLRVLAKSLALLAIAPVRGLCRLLANGSTTDAIYPVYIGLGRLMAEFGYVDEQYREPDKT